MEAFFIFVLVVAVVALILQGRQASARINDLAARLNRQEFELERLKRRGETSDAGSEPQAATPPPILTPPLTPDPVLILNRVVSSPPSQSELLPPVVEPEPAESAPAAKIPEPPAPKPAVFNWESFVGIKLFAWVGGLILFLGVAFFIKYSFDNNLISPAMRVTFGYLIGVGLVPRRQLTKPCRSLKPQPICCSS